MRAIGLRAVIRKIRPKYLWSKSEIAAEKVFRIKLDAQYIT